MKKIILAFGLIALQTINAQTWNIGLTNVASSTPYLGTSNLKPLNFFTNSAMRMSISQTGKIQFNDLAGSGDRFLQVDATGQLKEWIGNTMNAESVLYGDGTWKTAPITGNSGTFRMAANSKLGIGLIPTVELDVSGAGRFSGALAAGGVINSGSDITLANGFKFSYQPAVAGSSRILAFDPNLTPGGTPSYPNRPTKAPCNVWYKPTEFKDPNGLPYSVPWAPPTTNIFNDLIQIYESNAQNSVLSIGLLNGDGIIAVEPQSSNSNPQILKINPGCLNDVYICEGGGSTKIFNNTSVGGILRVGPGTNVTSGSQIDVFFNSTATKAITIADPALGGTNKNIFEVAKNGRAIIGSDIQPAAGSMLCIGQSVKTAPGISLVDNSLIPNLPLFNVYGDGKTEITSSNTDALIIKNSSNGSATTFNVKSNGQTYMAGNIGVGVLPSSSIFLNVSAGSNSSNSDLVSIGSLGTPNALLMNYNGVTTINANNVTSSFAFKVKNGSTDLLAVRWDGITFAREVYVTLGAFPDYVFSKEYKLPKLSEVKSYIKENNRLPHMPSSAEEIKKDGAPLGEVQRLTVEKVEELYLYVFQLEEKIDALNKKIKLMEKN